MNKTNDEKTLQHCLFQIEPNIARFYIQDVLDTCERLRYKVTILSRKLQRTRSANKRLQKQNQILIAILIEYMKNGITIK